MMIALPEHERRPRQFLARATVAVELAPPGVKSVLDLWCGHCDLLRVLPGGVQYLGLDKKPLKPRVVTVDLSNGLPSDFEGQYTVSFALGLFEYLADPLPLLSTLRSHARSLVCSVNTRYIGPESLAASLTQGGWFIVRRHKGHRTMFFVAVPEVT